MCVEIPIVTIGMFFGGYLVEHKEVIKNWIRKKKISKSMKHVWENRKISNFNKNISFDPYKEEVQDEDTKEDSPGGTPDTDSEDVTQTRKR